MNFEIPRLVHVIWIGPKVPGAVTELVERCAELNPDFEVRLWRDHDLQQLQNQYWFDMESKMSGKADIARYEVLRNLGGIYIDADFAVFRSLNPIIELGKQTGFVTCRESRAAFNNAFLAVSANHPLISILVEGVQRSMIDFRDSGPVTKSGPGYLTRSMLEHIASGGSVTELPQHWVYPYSYDRPDLASTAVSSETLLRHEWASIGNKWGEPANVGAVGSQVSRFAACARSVTELTKPGNLKRQLSRRPESHLIREAVGEHLSRLAGVGTPRVFKANKGVSPEASAPPREPRKPMLPSPVRFAVAREIRRRMRGSATFLDVGIPDADFWRLATRRIDRSGRAIRVTDVEGTERCLTELDSASDSRGSLALMTADNPNFSSGSRFFTQGVPLKPRVLDRMRTLDQWDDNPQTWRLDELLESCPHIELLVVWADADAQVLIDTVIPMSRAGRIGCLVVLVDPNSTTQRLAEYEALFAELETQIEHARCLGTMGKEGINTWPVQLRTAKRAFAIAFDFDKE